MGNCSYCFKFQSAPIFDLLFPSEGPLTHFYIQNFDQAHCLQRKKKKIVISMIFASSNVAGHFKQYKSSHELMNTVHIAAKN